MNIFYIGGSPCSGKSTVAEALSIKYGLDYFKVDDHLDKYMEMGAHDRKDCCSRISAMTPEMIWMRDPLVQCQEELMIYEEIFEYIQADLQRLDSVNGIITEGAAYLPKLAKQNQLKPDIYLSITPSKDFQVFHYKQREWVPHVLSGCSDQAKAFENWMERDALFACEVQRQCKEMGYTSIVNNGELPVDELTHRVAAHFGFL